MSEHSVSTSDSPAADQKRRLMLLAGAAAAIAVVAAIYLVFLSGGKSSTPTGAVPSTPHHVVASSSPSASPSSAAAVPAAYAVAAGRNPFSPLVTPPAASGTASGATGGGATATGAAATNAASPSASSSVALPTGIVLPSISAFPTPTVTVTASPTPTALPVGNQTLVLTAVDGATGVATVTVNGTTYQPKSGKVFGKYFKLVSILSGTDPTTNAPTYGADFEYGDQFVQLAVGQSATFGG
jgi:hypothetical protein